MSRTPYEEGADIILLGIKTQVRVCGLQTGIQTGNLLTRTQQCFALHRDARFLEKPSGRLLVITFEILHFSVPFDILS
jgi:hypothetical protein